MSSASAPIPPTPPNPPIRPLSRPSSPKRYLLVSSSGGVLLDLLALREWWSAQDAQWVAVAAQDTEETLAGLPVQWVPELKPSRPLAVVHAVVEARRRLAAFPADAVISAGSGVAVPWFVAARLAGVPALWVETFNVLGRPGLAARLCARLATAVVVQHEHLLGRHHRAVFVGELY